MRLLRFLLAVTLIGQLFLAGLAQAQGRGEIDYDAWENVTIRVERVIELDRAADQTLERLRSEVAVWRERFLEAQEDRSLRIQTLNRQLEALGLEPDGAADAAVEGEGADEAASAEQPAVPESDWVSERRDSIREDLADLQEPNLRAAEAFVHADGLIRELDAILRQRKADVVFARGPSPLNPLNWTAPVLWLEDQIFALPKEVFASLQEPEQRAEIMRSLLPAAITVAFGAFLLLRGRLWTAALRRAAHRAGPPVISFPLQGFVALIDVALPWFGLVAVLAGVTTSGLLGETGEALVQAVRRFGLFAIIGSAFVTRLIPPDPDEDPLLVPLSLEDARRARRVAQFTVLVFALSEGFSLFLNQVETPAEIMALWAFPFQVVFGYLLYRFARFFTTSAKLEDDETSFSLSLLDILARLGMLTGILAPLAAAAGFHGYATATLSPAAYTIFALGLVLFFSTWLKEVYAAIKRRPSDNSDLVPTLIDIICYAALIPVLALIWGARVADLTEVWNSIREGFSLGGVRISPTDIATFLLVFAIFFGVTRLLQAALRISILPKTKLDIGSRTAIVSGIGYIGVFLSAIVAIRSTGLDLSSLAIVAGALSVGIGFGLQTIVSNFVSGIILLIERPISEGDWIDVGGQQGYVRSISVRSTRIETFDRTDVIVPNSDLIAGTVTNWTRGNLVGRVIVPVGVAYGTDTAQVERILREIAEAHPMVLITPPPAVLFMRFGADALEFEIRAILRDVNFSLSVKSDLNHAIAKRFAEEKIEVPFAQRDLWLRNPEALAEGRSFSDTGGRHFVKVPEKRAPQPLWRDDVQDVAPPEGNGEGDAR